MTDSKGIKKIEWALLDTNILVYAHDHTTDPHKHALARQFIFTRSRSHGLCVSSQNLAEFFSVLSTKLVKTIPLALALQFTRDVSSVFEVHSYSASTVIRAAELSNAFRISIWDALLAATMLENGVQTIFTEDTKPFMKIHGIQAINPLA